MIKLLPYQDKAVGELIELLYSHGVAFLCGEMRTGKTLTALSTMKHMNTVERVLFVSPLAAHSSILNDFKASGLEMYFDLILINLESIHKAPDDCDAVIVDEVHRIGAYPKPGTYAKKLRKKIKGLPTILMSGTPSPESFCQLFHQFWVTGAGPWKHFANFYRFADHHVDKRVKFIAMGRMSNDYSHAKPSLVETFKPYQVTMTQKQAGFVSNIEEHFHTLPTPELIKEVLEDLRKKGYHEKYCALEADSMAKTSSFYHQLAGGTIIDSEGQGHTLSAFKAEYIKKQFQGSKIAIYYLFKEERNLLERVFANHTSSPETFAKSTVHTVFLSQIKAGSLGVNLSSADALILFNISFSAEAYLQVRERLKSRDRKKSAPVHFIMSDTGFEKAVYDIIVKEKKNFTTQHYTQYAGNIHTKKDRSAVKETQLGMRKASGNSPVPVSRPHGFKARRGYIPGSKETGGKGKPGTTKKSNRPRK